MNFFLLSLLCSLSTLSAFAKDYGTGDFPSKSLMGRFDISIGKGSKFAEVYQKFQACKPGGNEWDDSLCGGLLKISGGDRLLITVADKQYEFDYTKQQFPKIPVVEGASFVLEFIRPNGEKFNRSLLVPPNLKMTSPAPGTEFFNDEKVEARFKDFDSSIVQGSPQISVSGGEDDYFGCTDFSSGKTVTYQKTSVTFSPGVANRCSFPVAVRVYSTSATYSGKLRSGIILLDVFASRYSDPTEFILKPRK